MCVLAAIGGIAIWLGDKEPEYNGRKLSEWMNLARVGTFSERLKRIIERAQATHKEDPRDSPEAAAEAIEHIGTNGLPWFAKWMSYDTPKWKRAFLQSKYAKTAPKSVMRFIMTPIIRADQSREQLVFLGSNSVPYLVPIMDRYPADSSQVAVRALGQIGESALPPLLGVATNRAKPIQFRRLLLNTISTKNLPYPMRLRRLIMNTNTISPEMIPYAPRDQDDTSSLIPILMPCLQENGLEDSTIRLLGRLGLTADTAFQVFTNTITAKNPEVRIAAVRWAALFKSNANRATPQLIKAFNDPEIRVRQEATNALEKIAPEVLSD
jgi:hypothetical protein